MKADFSRQSLSSMVRQNGVSTDEIIPLARAMVEALGEFHNRRLIYGRLQPAGIFTELSVMEKEVIKVHFDLDIKENLAYISPEQSGRLGHPADYRSDFYSLGIVLFELSTGTRPYEHVSTGGMIHAHLTRSPSASGEAKDRRDTGFSRILSRLMEKDPGDRYQCCYDILADLDALEGRKDPAESSRGGGRISFPDSGFARGPEAAMLAAAEERGRTGETALFVLTGEAGSGKTTLVQHVFREAAIRGAVFISGKFDALHPRPYEGFRTAVKELVRRSLGRGDDEIREIREKLSESLPSGKKILFNLFPEAAPFIDVEDDTLLPRPEEARNLTGLLVTRFFAAFTDRTKPLILFLDDIQWAEDGSLLLVKQLARTAVPGLIMVLARRNSHHRDEPLDARDYFGQARPGITAVCLSPFTAAQTEEMMNTVFPFSEMDLKVLSTLVYAKSRGNPLFIRLYLQALEEEGLLYFDHLRGTWKGDIRKIAEAETSSDVVDFLVERLGGRSMEEKRALMLSACLGTTFEDSLLSELLSCSPEETRVVLFRALEDGLILQDSYSGGGYSFLHDRVRQAAYALAGEDEKLNIHRKIGSLLEERKADLFGAIHHYHLALETFTSREDRLYLRGLNQEVAILAKNSAAFDLFNRCMQTALELREADGWETDYPGTLSLFTDAAEAALLVFDYPAAENHAAEIRRHARDVFGSLASADILIRGLMARHRMKEAFETALQALESLRYPFPRRFLRLHSRFRTASVSRRLGRLKQPWQELAPMTGRRELWVLRILMVVASSSYIAVPEVFPLVACLMVDLHLKKGWTSSFAFSLSLFSNILMDRPLRGNLAARLDRTIVEICQMDLAGDEVQKIHFFANSMCRLWLGPLENTLEPLNLGYERGRERGDFEYALLCGQFFYLHSLFCCRNLGDLHEGLRKCTAAARELSQTRSIYGTNRLMQFYLNLTKKNDGGMVLTGDYFTEEIDMAHLQEVNDQCGLGTVRIYKLILALLLGEFQVAVDLSDETAPYIPALRGEYLVDLWVFHSGLARAALGGPGAHHYLTPVLKKLKGWTKNAPANFLHQYHLILAEKQRLKGHHEAAARLYHVAISGAEGHRFFFDAALARERLSWCYRDQGRSTEAEEALVAARDAFREYGCLLKVDSLEKQHPFLKNRISGPSFDADSVLEAARVISGEMIPERLAERLLSLVIENSGATRGVLFLTNREELKPEAEGFSHQESVRISHSPGAVPFPGTILRYVRRTGETVVLSNGAEQLPFGADAYLSQFRVLSVLCVPLIYRNDLKGIVYLENHRITGAFPAERAHLAGTIASQAAVSLENARLYQSLLEDIEARKQAERELLAAKERERDHQRKLLEADKLASLGMLAAGVAHEVNNPNHIVRLNAALLESAGPDILSLLDEAAQGDTSLLLGGLEYGTFRQQFPRLLSDIRECSDRIDTIVGELKNYAGKPSGGPPEPVDINGVVTSALRLCFPLTKKATNNLIFQAGVNLPAVKGVTQQLEQVMINLIQNACQALTSPDQQIRIETGLEGDAGILVVSVTDEGRGIPPDLAEQILEPFFTTRRDSGGTGLGLSVSRKIIKEHGGSLDITSEEGSGTRVRITLPTGEKR